MLRAAFICIQISIFRILLGAESCENGGTLLQNGTCQCGTNFEGLRCQTAKTSSTVPQPEVESTTKTLWGLPDCQHGTIDTETLSFPLKCKCDELWEGEHCDLPVCKNDGVRNNENLTCECVGDWVSTHCDEKPCDEYRKWSKDKKKCVCKKSGWEGDRCHLPICSEHGTRRQSNGTGFCECESELWYGELCTENKCGDKGTPYFSTTNETKCNCNEGWTGDTCTVKDCHGHGRPILNVICKCDFGFAQWSDCATCMYGWSGENCDQRDTDSSYSSNGDSGDIYSKNDDDDSKDDDDDSSGQIVINYRAILGIACALFLLAAVLSCIRRKISQQSGGRPRDSYAMVAGGAAFVDPVPQSIRSPRPYGPASPWDPRTSHGNNEAFLSNWTDSSYLNPGGSSTHYGPSAPVLPEEPPPPPYPGTDEEPPPPNYEDAIKT